MGEDQPLQQTDAAVHHVVECVLRFVSEDKKEGKTVCELLWSRETQPLVQAIGDPFVNRVLAACRSCGLCCEEAPKGLLLWWK